MSRYTCPHITCPDMHVPISCMSLYHMMVTLVTMMMMLTMTTLLLRGNGKNLQPGFMQVVVRGGGDPQEVGLVGCYHHLYSIVCYHHYSIVCYRHLSLLFILSVIMIILISMTPGRTNGKTGDIDPCYHQYRVSRNRQFVLKVNRERENNNSRDREV